MTLYCPEPALKPLSITDVAALKQRGEKISCLTAYDASFAALLDRVGIEIILIGDSLGMVIQGATTTLPVTMDDMLYHCRCVATACRRAFLLADLPFLSYTSVEQALHNAGRLLQQGGAQMVKLEGARLNVISSLVTQGIPVCGHLGLLPQSVNQLGGYKVQGKDNASAEQMLADALAIEQAGASLLILECVPASLAATISQKLQIPVIGIGAGVDCDGQVLVLHDLLGVSSGKRPRFCKNFMADAHSIEQAIVQYRQAVKNAEFPGPEHSY